MKSYIGPFSQNFPVGLQTIPELFIHSALIYKYPLHQPIFAEKFIDHSRTTYKYSILNIVLLTTPFSSPIRCHSLTAPHPPQPLGSSACLVCVVGVQICQSAIPTPVPGLCIGVCPNPPPPGDLWSI